MYFAHVAIWLTRTHTFPNVYDRGLGGRMLLIVMFWAAISISHSTVSRNNKAQQKNILTRFNLHSRATSIKLYQNYHLIKRICQNMKETIIILLIIALYVLISFVTYRYLLKLRLLVFILACSVYLLFTYFLFDFFVYIHQDLRSRGVYLEFGHADLLLLETFAVCLLIATINIILAILKKCKIKKADSLSKNKR
jgi:hypothetical protein